MNKEIIFGTGCFWCSEAVFSQVKGVIQVTPGYSGGHKNNPSYEEVCSGLTGHAEVVKIQYDDNIISLRELLEIFLAIHDPTSLNRQGNDIGEQYRSAIYVYNKEDYDAAKKFLEEKAKYFIKPIVTEVDYVKNFYEAEDYHKMYFFRNRRNPYCKFVIEPKLDKVRKNFYDLIIANKD